MKKFLYSTYTKAVCVILFILCITSAAVVSVNSLTDYFGEKEQVYAFEKDFSSCLYINSMLAAPENAVYHAICNTVPDKYEERAYEGDYNTDEIQTVISQADKPAIEEKIESYTKALYCADTVNYRIEWNGRVFTNCSEDISTGFEVQNFYNSFILEEDGSYSRDFSGESSSFYIYDNDFIEYENLGTLKIVTVLRPEAEQIYSAMWERQSQCVIRTFIAAVALIAAALILFIYLAFVAGKSEDGEKSMAIDKLYTEVHLAAIAFFLLGGILLFALLLDSYFANAFLPKELFLCIAAITAAVSSAAVLCATLSLVRSIKKGTFLKSSVIFRLLSWCIKLPIRFFKHLFSALSLKTGIILISGLTLYTAATVLFSLLMTESAAWLIFTLLTFLFAAFLLAVRSHDTDEIKKGIKEIHGGNVSYKIPELKCEDLKEAAENINNLGQGLEDSVTARLKAERLKTELITNVSHDLKTPITSIINYAQLLSRTEGLPTEAADYADIILKKGERLNTLTRDLFDISKAQSGNDTVVPERLSAALLISQALGEHDSEIKASGLTVVVNTPKEQYIFADGKKLSRVIGNLLSNILKYTMANTRVFITAKEENGRVVMEFKNISAYPMNFKADEIVGRFVRGDEARSTEGSGLGLAIAKSYTELCGGKFDIVIDGDMFKAILSFEKYS